MTRTHSAGSATVAASVSPSISLGTRSTCDLGASSEVPHLEPQDGVPDTATKRDPPRPLRSWLPHSWPHLRIDPRRPHTSWRGIASCSRRAPARRYSVVGVSDRFTDSETSFQMLVKFGMSLPTLWQGPV
jgi:hypothetical protein